MHTSYQTSEKKSCYNGYAENVRVGKYASPRPGGCWELTNCILLVSYYLMLYDIICDHEILRALIRMIVVVSVRGQWIWVYCFQGWTISPSFSHVSRCPSGSGDTRLKLCLILSRVLLCVWSILYKRKWAAFNKCLYSTRSYPGQIWIKSGSVGHPGQWHWPGFNPDSSVSATLVNILGADCNPKGNAASTYNAPSHVMPRRDLSSGWIGIVQ